MSRSYCRSLKSDRCVFPGQESKSALGAIMIKAVRASVIVIGLMAVLASLLFFRWTWYGEDNPRSDIGEAVYRTKWAFVLSPRPPHAWRDFDHVPWIIGAVLVLAPSALYLLREREKAVEAEAFWREKWQHVDRSSDTLLRGFTPPNEAAAFLLRAGPQSASTNVDELLRSPEVLNDLQESADHSRAVHG